MTEIALFRPQNIPFDRFVSFSRKQKKGETLKQFYSILKELAQNCDFQNCEQVIIRDIFITNMLDDDTQRELLRDTKDPDRALSIAVNMGMRHQNQQQISSSNNNKAIGNAFNVIQSINRLRGPNARVKQSCRISLNRAANSQCINLLK